MTPKQLGTLGEKIACQYLKNKGYKILDKNYSVKWISGPQKGEIDIVAKKEEAISFVEVKALRFAQGKPFFPEDRVNFQKQRKIIKMAQNWLREKKILLNTKWQIDIISVRIDLERKRARLRHFKNAFC